jgi:hypothetical protein
LQPHGSGLFVDVSKASAENSRDNKKCHPVRSPMSFYLHENTRQLAIAIGGNERNDRECKKEAVLAP